uniref:Uncharacterized protein n=1 Tax=Meloidogyne enterolobii TaxID=390850 RepID=A0A6V7V9C4_MELEN|nr:unnamed protein product [Meloidogyne enterolobii]
MFKFLILTCLIIETHSWGWYSDPKYPSPKGTNFWKCRVSKPTYVCDPDGMLTDVEREKIIELVEDFKEKTKRPNSTIPCMREGLRLVVALAKDKIGFGYPGNTYLCSNGIGQWKLPNTTKCESDNALLNKNNTFDALKNYIINLRSLYIQRFSTFDYDVSNENKSPQQYSYKLLAIISIIISLILGLVLLILICQRRQIQNYLDQRNASNTETQLMTPMQPVEVVKKRREREEARNLVNL